MLIDYMIKEPFLSLKKLSLPIQFPSSLSKKKCLIVRKEDQGKIYIYVYREGSPKSKVLHAI